MLKITRGAYVDAVHSGHLVLVRSDGQVAACAGYRDYPAVLRSGMKPLQLLGVIASGAVERFGFEDRELAVAASSHSGEAEHVDAVRSMLNKIGMGESDLRCGVHPPFMPHVAADMARAGVQPSPIHNNCSGKHTSMLAGLPGARPGPPRITSVSNTPCSRTTSTGWPASLQSISTRWE